MTVSETHPPATATASENPMDAIRRIKAEDAAKKAPVTAPPDEISDPPWPEPQATDPVVLKPAPAPIPPAKTPRSPKAAPSTAAPAAEAPKAVAVKPDPKQLFNDPRFISQIQRACGKHMTADRILRIALTACLASPKLNLCFTTTAGVASVAKALLTCTQRGLEPDGRQAHLAPFNCKMKDGTYAMLCQFMPGYQGLIDLAYNHPNVTSIVPEVVYEKDHFVHVKGLRPVLEHIPFDGADRGKLKYAYAICWTKNGGAIPRVLNQIDIARARSSSRNASEPDSIWNIHEEAMWLKTAVRNLCKFIPQSAELRDALSSEDEAERTTVDIASARVPTDVLSLPSPGSDNDEPLIEG